MTQVPIWPLRGSRRKALNKILAEAHTQGELTVEIRASDLANLLHAADENMTGIMRRSTVVSFLDWLRRNEVTCTDLARQMALHFGLERELARMEKQNE